MRRSFENDGADKGVEVQIAEEKRVSRESLAMKPGAWPQIELISVRSSSDLIRSSRSQRGN